MVKIYSQNPNYTGCGRKESVIWKANKFETKEDTVNVFFISGKYTEYRFTSTKHHSSGGLEY
jgi:hypothetical protein